MEKLKAAPPPNNQHKQFIIADTHFNHENIIKYTQRPFNNYQEMNRVLMDNWNGVVGGMDVVWMLGDFGVARKGAPPLSRILRDLKGKKILVVGNHDYETYSKYIDWGFSAVMHEAIVEVGKARVLLRHTPVVGGVKIYDGVDYVMHGHIHQTPTLEVRNATEAFRQLNVSVEQIKYTPLSLEAAVARVRKQALKYG